MAVLVLMMTAAGIIMTQDGISRDVQNSLFIFHKNVGVLMILLIAIRLGIRFTQPPPPEPETLPRWQARIASLTHVALYALLIVMPIAGYVRVKAGGFPIEGLDAMGVPSLVPRSDELASVAKAVHFYGGRLLVLLVLVHIGAALFHAVIKRDGVFQRMWPMSAAQHAQSK
ncbi:MAG: cytochrome b [Devosiaceae bacterium]|nr:cytochrome b [Devosiaceae bacterium MH13]